MPRLNRRTAIGIAILGSAFVTTELRANKQEIMPMNNAIKAIRKIDYTVVFARDMDGMQTFYGDVMGFELRRELSPSWLEYHVGSNILALTVRGTMFDDVPTPEGALSLQLAFRVTPAEVDACADYLLERDVEIVAGPTDQAWGHRTLFFRDPDGNVLEIYADI